MRSGCVIARRISEASVSLSSAIGKVWVDMYSVRSVSKQDPSVKIHQGACQSTRSARTNMQLDHKMHKEKIENPINHCYWGAFFPWFKVNSNIN